jgi:hypothetical protein
MLKKKCKEREKLVCRKRELVKFKKGKKRERKTKKM